MIKNPLIILGAGGFAREAFCWIAQTGRTVTAFYDEFDGGARAVYGLPVIHDLTPYAGCDFIGAVGDPVVRARLSAEAKAKGLRAADPIIHHTVTLGTGVWIKPGAILCPGVVVTADVRLGEGVLLNLNSTVGHDCELGAYVTVSPGANISGHCTLQERAYVGTNAALREGVMVGIEAVVGMGAVVLKNVPDGAIVVGNPARQRSLQPVD